MVDIQYYRTVVKTQRSWEILISEMEDLLDELEIERKNNIPHERVVKPTLAEIDRYLCVNDYPKIPKGSMTVGRPQPGLGITYDDGEEKFTVCCDDSNSQKQNRDKCVEIILSYLNSKCSL